MFAMPQAMMLNKFLARLTSKDHHLLLPHLHRVRLSERENIYTPGDLIEQIYFPLHCVVSSVTLMKDGASVETSMTGRESLTGIAAAFYEERARNPTRVLIPGDALRMKAEVLRELFRSHETLRVELMHCYRRLIEQVSQRAVCSSRHVITRRFCCWLLMIHDRVGANEFPLTHDLIAGQLGARRAGITVAASTLQTTGAIRYSRGHMRIVNRSLIESAACECYLTYKSEFRWFDNRAEAEARKVKVRVEPQNRRQAVLY